MQDAIAVRRILGILQVSGEPLRSAGQGCCTGCDLAERLVGQTRPLSTENPGEVKGSGAGQSLGRSCCVGSAQHLDESFPRKSNLTAVGGFDWTAEDSRQFSVDLRQLEVRAAFCDMFRNLCDFKCDRLREIVLSRY